MPKIRDPYIGPEIQVFSKWLRDRGIPNWVEWKKIPKRKRSELWRDHQRERWGFTHFFGDECRGDDGPGHVERLLWDLDHGGTFDLSIPWTTARAEQELDDNEHWLDSLVGASR